MYVSMNNPLTSPEQLEYNGPKLDPEYDDLPDYTEIIAVDSNGHRHELIGEAELMEFVSWCSDEGLAFNIISI
jgi:hypothetical protein